MILHPRVVFGGLELTEYPFAIVMDEGDDGVAQNVYVSLDSELRDGTIVSRTTTQNREVTRTVLVEGDDLLAVAEATAALARECEKVRNTLMLDPGDSFAPPKVYETFVAQMVEVALPGGEEAALRLFRITWPALPFARSVEPFTVTGVTSAASPSTVTLSDGTSTTGWTSDGGLTVSTSGGAVEVPLAFESYLDSYRTLPIPLRFSGTFDMSATQYLVVDVAVDPFPGPGITRAYADGVQLARLAQTSSPFGYPFVRETYLCPDASVSQFHFTHEATGYSGGTPPASKLRVTNLARSNVAPSTGTLRQKTTTVDVPGSARTPASLLVAHGSSGLGNVLVYTGPALGQGYAPALSPYRTVAPLTDASTVSGGYQTGADVFDVPATRLPSGQYQIVARTRSASATAVEATLRLGGVNVGATQVPGVGVAMGAADAESYYLVACGSFFLPPHEVGDNSTAVVRVTATAGGSERIDEVWAFYLPDDGSAALSYVPCGTSQRLWLNAATVQRPYPSALVGTAADGADAIGVDGSTANWTEHLFPAGEDQVVTVTTGALDAEVSVTGYALWHTHPATA